MRKRLPVVIVFLVSSIFVAVGIVGAHDATGDHDHVDPHESMGFPSVEEAQAAVPFDIKLPDPSSGFVDEGANVTVSSFDQGNTIVTQVDVYLRGSDGNLVLLLAGDGPVKPWGTGEGDDGVTEIKDVKVNGSSGLAITGNNVEGEVVGVVYWTVDGITYRIVQMRNTGPELVSVAESVQ